MIERLHGEDGENAVWVVRPTRSLTWQEAKRWLCIISFIPLSSALVFLWFGVPFVLPFAGLEVGLLWAAFYYVAWQGEMREVIELTPQRLIVQKGRHCPNERFEYERAWVRVDLDENRGWHPSRLRVVSHGRGALLGTFLTDGERRSLASALINALNKSR